MLPRVAVPGPKTTFFAAFIALSLANCVLIAEVDFSRIPKEDGGGGSGASPVCSIDTDCNDDLPCTSDDCESGLCTHTPLAEGTECGSVTCVSSSTCDANGECISASVVIDDGNGCTNDFCDPTTGSITHGAVNVDDMIACTTDACDPATGAITHTPMGTGCLSWQALPTNGAPSARQQHTAVWTGSKMIIWGGAHSVVEPPLNTGGVYDPTNHTWKPTSLTNAPEARHSHQAVWTGSKMIVWGGFGTSALATSGGIYDPETDSWAPLPATGEPAGRTKFTALWNGTAMFVFGGTANKAALTQGAAFNPTTNAWTNLPTSGQPMGRLNHTAVWTGDRMIIWGGQNLVDWLWTGGSYNPTTNAWMGPTPGSNAPAAREQQSAVWTGTEMLVWGGWDGGFYLNSGATFDPATSTWKATSTTGAPEGRAGHSAVWTGKTLVVWGGCGKDLCGKLYADGGIFTPDASGGSWSTISAVDAMPPRSHHTTVWTGSSMIVWGGADASENTLDTGAETPL